MVVFALRYLVQNYLYDTDQVGWLAAVRLAMGYPLFIVADLRVSVWIVAGTTRLRVPGGGLRHGLAGLARGAPPPPSSPPNPTASNPTFTNPPTAGPPPDGPADPGR